MRPERAAYRARHLGPSSGRADARSHDSAGQASRNDGSSGAADRDRCPAGRASDVVWSRQARRVEVRWLQ